MRSTHEIHAYEILAYEMHAYEIHAYETHAHDAYPFTGNTSSSFSRICLPG
jgi:hypothetical protein